MRNYVSLLENHVNLATDPTCALSGVADALTTRAAITSGRGREGNPFMVWATRNTPRAVLVKTAANVVASVSLHELGKTKPKTAVLIVAALVALQLTVAVRNHQIAEGQ